MSKTFSAFPSLNRYFIGQRSFELPELKLLVDTVESSRFISATQSGSLVSKLYDMASVHQASELNRHLYVDGRVKSDSRTLCYTVDLIHKAINDRKRILNGIINMLRKNFNTILHGRRFHTPNATPTAAAKNVSLTVSCF